MNYIDINSVEDQSLNININLEESISTTATILWTIYKDGSDSPVAVLNNSQGYASVTDHKYYQKLSLDLSNLDFDEDLVDETQYTIEGLYNGTLVYRGKFQTTSKDLNSYSINEGEYTKQTTNNNFTILD